MLVTVHLLVQEDPESSMEVSVSQDYASGPVKYLLERIYMEAFPRAVVGDVIELKTVEPGFWLITMQGFAKLSPAQFEQWRAVPRGDRHFHEWTYKGVPANEQ